MDKAKENRMRTIRSRQRKKKAEFIEVFAKSLALVASTCRKIGITSPTFYNWYNEDEEFAAKVDEVRELAKDQIEAKIYEKVSNGDTTMLIFYAKTKMKDRGYYERKEFVGRDGTQLVPVSNSINLDCLTEEQRDALKTLGQSILNSTDE